METVYDLLIIGSGPAGLTAAIYASRYKIKHAVIGKILGGLASEAHKVCNFPSEKEIGGFELVQKMVDAAKHQGGEIIAGGVQSVEKDGEIFVVRMSDGAKMSAKTILIASGTEHRKLELDREQEFVGKGISYCATCDAMFYRGATVAVVGGSDAALTSALYLSGIAKKVYQIYRGAELRGDPTWIEQVQKKENIEVLCGTVITELVGTASLEGVHIQTNGIEKEIDVDGLFVEIGSEPHTEAYESLGIEMDDKNYISVGRDQSTSVEGVWAAGDITNGSNNFRQIITAASEGAVAAESIFKYHERQK